MGSWTPTFQDEFDGTALNAGKWRPCLMWGCGGGIGNSLNCHLPENDVVGNGVLDLQGHLSTGTCQPDGFTYHYSSGEIQSGARGHRTGDALFEQPYGFFEARLWVASGQGYQSGFWLKHPGLGSSDPSGQDELDVVEILGNDTSDARMTIHWGNPDGSNAQSGTHYVGPQDYAGGWHTFGLDWEPGSVTWYVDGVVRKTYTDTAHIPSSAMDLRVNLDIGGSWAGEPNSTTPWPAHYRIDYMRAWRH